MKAYLNALSDREKWMVIVTGLCLILYLYYLFLYAPLNHRLTQKSNQLVEKAATLEWLKKVKQQGLLSSKKLTVDSSQLLTLLATKLKESTMLAFPYQLQQTGSGEIQITFDAVAFNLFIGWLKEISEHYVISIKEFQAERTSSPGVSRLMILITC